MREEIKAKTNGRCYYCGTILPERWHVDHIKPLVRVLGEPQYPERDNFDNLVPACPPCNLYKGSSNLEEFRQLIENTITQLNRDITIFRHAKRFGLVKETGNKVKFYFESLEGEEW